MLARGDSHAWAMPEKRAGPTGAPTPGNINAANLLELTLLLGIDCTRAEAIANSLDEHGPFKTRSCPMESPGIVRKTFEKLEPLISVRDRKAPFFRCTTVSGGEGVAVMRGTAADPDAKCVL